MSLGDVAYTRLRRVPAIAVPSDDNLAALIKPASHVGLVNSALYPGYSS